MNYNLYNKVILARKDIVEPIKKLLEQKFGLYFYVDNRTDSEDDSTHNYVFVLKEYVTPATLAHMRLYAHGIAQGVRIAIDNKITE